MQHAFFCKRKENLDKISPMTLAHKNMLQNKTGILIIFGQNAPSFSERFSKKKYYTSIVARAPPLVLGWKRQTAYITPTCRVASLAVPPFASYVRIESVAHSTPSCLPPPSRSPTHEKGPSVYT